MRQSDFNLKRNTNSNKTDKKDSPKINKFRQLMFQNSLINYLICVAIQYIGSEK